MSLEWELSSSSDPEALAVVDGTGQFSSCGPHYSRRTPGSKTFTGVGQEVVLITGNRDAVWAAVRQKIPTPRGQGSSRGRDGRPSESRYVWRNMMYRNLGPRLSSRLILSALRLTYAVWKWRYGALPAERLRTEVDTRKVKSRNPGYCYLMAGWERGPIIRGLLHLYAPLVEYP